RVARTGTGLGTLGVAVGLALVLHRSALALLPAWAVCAALALRAGAWRGRQAERAPRPAELGEPPQAAPSRPPAISRQPRLATLAGLVSGLVAPPLALAIVGPRLVHIVGSFDTQKHMQGGNAGATIAAALGPGHLLDVLHTVCLLVPVAPLVPLLLWLGPRPSRRETLALGALVLPPLALLLL